ncbi:Pas15 [Actinoplanes phage phiAsp2]|uniref:Pas15 n=1 Tax=Actinoplanes phage phiAsp2 TaxID=279303 RepID=Q6J816_9CAUD|nr:Pas15 [Actinoplanes phage phiAsp2]AAT36763.1 Pas15 [Actinoplanes phage phiAsp2]
MIPAPIVPAPERLRRRYGLFDAASGPLDFPAHGEGGGVRFQPLECGRAYPYGVACYGVENPAPAKPLDQGNDEVSTGVFVVLATVNCGAVGYTDEEFRTQARRRLEGNEQAAVEAAFWTGLDFEGQSLDILDLNGAAEDVDPGYDPGLITDVVGALERYAYTEQGYGGVAYIHAPIEVAAFAAEAGLVLPETSGPNGRKVTPLGSVWSFGAYPAGSIIVTGQTTVWRSAEIVVHNSFDQNTNEVLMVAERAYAVAHECFAGRAEFDPLEVVSP